jgi:short subunit dehydrogenase-like uncharacterized protein
MSAGRTVAVFGASGHTGRFVVAELRARGFVPLLVGRDAAKLRAAAMSEPGPGPGSRSVAGAEEWVRVASVGAPGSLDRAFAGADAVVNCAGPFAETAAPVIEAAVRAGIPYVDVAAEIEANLDTFARFEEPARAAGVAVVPAMAFFGGLGDLLVTAATESAGWTAVDEAHIAYGLSGWHPTAGTRDAGAVSRQRRGGRRVRYADGRLEYRDDAAPATKWDFPEPMGTRAVIGEFSMADIVTVPTHLAVPEVRTYMTVEAARDLAAPDTPAPVAVDEHGRSAQTFVVDVVVRSGGVERRATARGQDIYAVSAPLAVEAVRRVIEGRVKGAGVLSAGAAFDAADFLGALSAHVSVELGR